MGEIFPLDTNSRAKELAPKTSPPYFRLFMVEIYTETAKKAREWWVDRNSSSLHDQSFDSEHDIIIYHQSLPLAKELPSAEGRKRKFHARANRSRGRLRLDLTTVAVTLTFGTMADI
jgi:hypothetical protein